MKKKVAILQSNYIPWKGYFDLINSVDEFIIYDDMQYTKRDWRNRNKIKTLNGLRWLSIPVSVKGKYHQKINETLISDPKWASKHWDAIVHSYKKSPYFMRYKDSFESFYTTNDDLYLSNINIELIKLVNTILGITTKISLSSSFELVEGQTERLLDLCEQVGATEYLSGPAARGYFDENLAVELGIGVEWMSYNDYPEYNQMTEPFDHGVSIIDLIFNEGPNATKFMTSFA